MKCLWPSTKHPSVNPPVANMHASCEKSAVKKSLPKMVSTLVLLLLLSGVISWCSADTPVRVRPNRAPLSESERTLRRVPAHVSEFSPLSAPLAVARCGNVRPPEALLTPDPLLPADDESLLVRVSFIVGSDGHVHSAFVLSSEGPDEDEAVLHAVRFWRYRPALCNGVPTDSEARVRFTVR